jgi:hypothetical protein
MSIRVVPRSSEYAEAARLAELFLNDALVKRLPPPVEQEIMRETLRQVLHGLPPSEGVPDVRPCYPLYPGAE